MGWCERLDVAADIEAERTVLSTVDIGMVYHYCAHSYVDVDWTWRRKLCHIRHREISLAGNLKYKEKHMSVNIED